MTFLKFVRKADHVLCEARKDCRIIVVGVMLGVMAVLGLHAIGRTDHPSRGLSVQNPAGHPVISALESIDCGGDGTDRVRQSETLFVDRIVKTDPWHPGGQVFRGNSISTGPVSEMDHASLPAHMATPSGSEMHPHDTVAQKRWNQAPQNPSET